MFGMRPKKNLKSEKIFILSDSIIVIYKIQIPFDHRGEESSSIDIHSIVSCSFNASFNFYIVDSWSNDHRCSFMQKKNSAFYSLPNFNAISQFNMHLISN